MMPSMKAYSLDLRERILKACDEGATEVEAAARFGVSQDTVQRYKRRRRETGSVAATPCKGRSPKIKQEQSEALRELVASKTNWTLDSLSDAWHKKTGVKLAITTLSATCQRLKITFKKDPNRPGAESFETGDIPQGD
jgi:transposase